MLMHSILVVQIVKSINTQILWSVTKNCRRGQLHAHLNITIKSGNQEKKVVFVAQVKSFL